MNLTQYKQYIIYQLSSINISGYVGNEKSPSNYKYSSDTGILSMRFPTEINKDKVVIDSPFMEKLEKSIMKIRGTVVDFDMKKLYVDKEKRDFIFEVLLPLMTDKVTYSTKIIPYQLYFDFMNEKEEDAQFEGLWTGLIGQRDKIVAKKIKYNQVVVADDKQILYYIYANIWKHIVYNNRDALPGQPYVNTIPITIMLDGFFINKKTEDFLYLHKKDFYRFGAILKCASNTVTSRINTVFDYEFPEDLSVTIIPHTKITSDMYKFKWKDSEKLTEVRLTW